MIDFVFEDIAPFSFKIDEVKNWVDNSIANEKKVAGDICFIFCSDTYLLKINQEYLKHDFFTDVISFDYSSGEIISGDIFISIDRIKDNAEQFGVSFDNELLRIIIHGVLHLCGYSDKSKKSKNIMTLLEDKYLEGFYNVEGV